MFDLGWGPKTLRWLLPCEQPYAQSAPRSFTRLVIADERARQARKGSAVLCHTTHPGSLFVARPVGCLRSPRKGRCVDTKPQETPRKSRFCIQGPKTRTCAATYLSGGKSLDSRLRSPRRCPERPLQSAQCTRIRAVALLRIRAVDMKPPETGETGRFRIQGAGKRCCRRWHQEYVRGDPIPVGASNGHPGKHLRLPSVASSTGGPQSRQLFQRLKVDGPA